MSIVITAQQISLTRRPGARMLAFSRLKLNDAIILQYAKVILIKDKLGVSYPSQTLTESCPDPKCGEQNFRLIQFCNRCGCRLDRRKWQEWVESGGDHHIEVVYDTTDKLQPAVRKAYYAEKQRSRRPGYRSDAELIDVWGDEKQFAGPIVQPFEVTDVDVTLVHGHPDRRGLCSLTINECLVLDNFEIKLGVNGETYVEPPRRPRTSPCAECGERNPRSARYCGGCGRQFQTSPLGQTDKDLYMRLVCPLGPAAQLLYEPALAKYERVSEALFLEKIREKAKAAGL